MATTFVVGGPQIPKDPGFGGFRPIPVLLVPSIWPKNACVMPNWKSLIYPAIWPEKPVVTGNHGVLVPQHPPGIRTKRQNPSNHRTSLAAQHEVLALPYEKKGKGRGQGG